jgi:hypothetical protein
VVYIFSTCHTPFPYYNEFLLACYSSLVCFEQRMTCACTKRVPFQQISQRGYRYGHAPWIISWWNNKCVFKFHSPFESETNCNILHLIREMVSSVLSIWHLVHNPSIPSYLLLQYPWDMLSAFYIKLMFWSLSVVLLTSKIYYCFFSLFFFSC